MILIRYFSAFLVFRWIDEALAASFITIPRFIDLINRNQHVCVCVCVSTTHYSNRLIYTAEHYSFIIKFSKLQNICITTIAFKRYNKHTGLLPPTTEHCGAVEWVWWCRYAMTAIKTKETTAQTTTTTAVVLYTNSIVLHYCNRLSAKFLIFLWHSILLLLFEFDSTQIARAHSGAQGYDETGPKIDRAWQ